MRICLFHACMIDKSCLIENRAYHLRLHSPRYANITVWREWKSVAMFALSDKHLHRIFGCTCLVRLQVRSGRSATYSCPQFGFPRVSQVKYFS